MSVSLLALARKSSARSTRACAFVFVGGDGSLGVSLTAVSCATDSLCTLAIVGEVGAPVVRSLSWLDIAETCGL
jgi:hypothetical protein